MPANICICIVGTCNGVMLGRDDVLGDVDGKVVIVGANDDVTDGKFVGIAVGDDVGFM